MVYGASLENLWAQALRGSNPLLSALEEWLSGYSSGLLNRRAQALVGSNPASSASYLLLHPMDMARTSKEISTIVPPVDKFR